MNTLVGRVSGRTDLSIPRRTAMAAQGAPGTLAPADLAALTAQKVVDARGTSCPGPILAAKKGMVSLRVGDLMEVLATDSGTLRDLPAWARKMGHEFLGVVEEAGYLRLYVKKAK
jgi:TusA-related sulfurtransferase